MADRLKIFFDGGSRPMPGGMEIAIVACGVPTLRLGLGAGSSMDAEWLALIEAMAEAVRRGAPDTLLLGDAAAVIAQANGTARCPASCRAHLERFHALPRPAGRLAIRHIGRGQNLAGIALAKLHER